MDQPTTDPRSPPVASGVQMRSFLVLIVAHFIVDGVGQTWTIFKKLENLDVARAGLIFAVGVSLAQLLQPFFGLWADRGHRRAFVVAGMAVVPVTILVALFGRHATLLHSDAGYAVMFGIVLVSKLGSALFHPAAGSAAGEGDPDRRHARLGLFIGSGMAGMAMGQWIFSTVYTVTDKRPGWLFVPIYFVVLLAAFWFRPPEPRRKKGLSAGSVRSEFKEVGWRLLPLWVLQVLSGATIVCLHFLLPELAEERGCPKEWVYGGGFFILMAGTALMGAPIGYLADRFGRRKVSTVCLVGGAAMYFVVVLGSDLSLWQFGVVLFLYGGIHASAAPILIAHAQHIVTARRGMVTGVMMGWAWAASALATWVVGSLVRDSAMSYAHALAWLGIPGVLAALIALVFRGD